MSPGHCGASPVSGQERGQVPLLLIVDAPDLLEQGLFRAGGQLGRHRRGVPINQTDQPRDESLGCTDNLLDTFGKECRIVGLLLRK